MEKVYNGVYTRCVFKSLRINEIYTVDNERNTEIMMNTNE
jgi:hypothetical protein